MTPSHLNPAPDDSAAAALPQQLFQVDVRLHRNVVHLVALGELDLATADQLRAQLNELLTAGFKRLIIDLRQLTFIDSTGLALLVRYHEAAQNNGWQLSLIQGPPQIQRLFKLTGLLDRLPFTALHPA
jgi:anti-anti-sigma factor